MMERTKKELKDRRVDLALLSEPCNVTYVSGFEIPVRKGATVDLLLSPPLEIIGTDDAETCLVVSSLDSTIARKSNRLDELLIYAPFDHFKEVDAQKAFLDCIYVMLKKADAKNKGTVLGVETTSIPLAVVEMIRMRFPGIQIVDITDALLQARMVKTEREIGLIRKAVQLNDLGQTAMLEFAVPGISEIDLCQKVVSRLQATAGRQVSMAIDFVSGKRTASPVYPGGPINHDICKGDMAIFDLSVRNSGYWADTTNTFVIGAEPTDEQKRFFRVSKDAFKAVLGVMRPGVRACDVERAARNVYERHGCSVPHYAGHQIGVHINDLPRFVQYDQTLLEADMVFSVETGAYAGPPGKSGARTEKVVLITQKGSEILSRFKWGI